MKKISAHYIFPFVSAPLKKGIIVINNEGIILEITDTGGQLRESDRLEFHNGIIIPGIEGLTIDILRQRQHEMPDAHLNDILKSFAAESERPQGFVSGQKATFLLISPLDMVNLRLTEKSKLKKLV